MTRRLPLRLAPIATALALVFFASSIARHHPDAATAAEAGLLATLVGLVLAALSLSARAAPAVVTGGALVALALLIPAGEGTRGALVGTLLAATVGWSAWRAFVDGEQPGWTDAAAVTIAWQAMLRGERLLALDATTAVWLLALPLAAAVAAVLLARERGGPAALVTLAALWLLVPGAGVVPVAVLAILAAAAGGRCAALPNAIVIVAASATAMARLPPAAVPLLVLVAALALRPRAGWRWLPALGAGLWVVAPWVLAGASPPRATQLVWLAVALPAALVTTRDRWPLVIAALALALAPTGGEPAVLAPAVGLAAFAVAERHPRPQAGWSLGLLGAAALAACYPWFRRPALELLDGLPDWPVVALAVVAALAALRIERVPAALRRRTSTAGWTLALVAMAALAGSRQRSLADDAVLLTADSSAWSASLAAGTVERLTVDTFLTGSAEIAVGTAVATVRLAAGEEHRELVLRHGEHTADWSARRLDSAAPPPWITWLAGDGSRAQRYRAVWELESPFAADRVEIVRRPDLGEGPRLAVLHVGVR